MKIFSLLLGLLIGAQASAANLDGKMGFGGGLGLSIPTNSQFVKDNAAESLNGSLWLRNHLTNNWNLELAYDRLELGGIDGRLDHVNLLLGYRFWESNFSPLVGIGLGMGNVNNLISDGDYSTFAAKVRAGFDWFFCEDRMSTGLNLDFHFASAHGHQANEVYILSPLLSLTYYFSPKGKTASVKSHHEVAKVAMDTDKDGVVDSMDKCMSTKNGVKVGMNGCEMDSDNDGIVDSMDKCSGTSTGTKVNSFGCSEKEGYEVTLNVKFDTGKSNVKAAYHNQLEVVAKFLKQFPNATAEIQGHTDSSGSHAGNTALSLKRASAVRAYIVNKFSVKETRLTAVGYGPDQPIADNSTAAGRATNRRVVAKMSSK